MILIEYVERLVASYVTLEQLETVGMDGSHEESTDPIEGVGADHPQRPEFDPLPQLRQWVDRVYHIHGKDATVLWDVVKTRGTRGGAPYVFHRTPGFGDTNWTDVISILRQGGFKGAIDIEGWHDPVYRGDLEMTGQVHGLNYLKQCRGGPFVPNPV